MCIWEFCHLCNSGQRIQPAADRGQRPAENPCYEQPRDAGDVAKDLKDEQGEELVLGVNLLYDIKI